MFEFRFFNLQLFLVLLLLSHGDEVAGEDVAEDGDGDASVVPLTKLCPLKQWKIKMSLKNFWIVRKEVLSHGEEVDGEDEAAVDGDGGVSADQQRILPQWKYTMY